MRNVVVSQAKALIIPEKLTTVLSVVFFVFVMFTYYLLVKADSKGMFISDYFKTIFERNDPRLIDWIRKQISLNENTSVINFAVYHISKNEYEISVETDDFYESLWNDKYRFKDKRGEETVIKNLTTQIEKIGSKKINILFNEKIVDN